MPFVDLEPGDERLARDVLPVLQELRPHLTPAAFAAVYAEGYPEGLRFTASYDDRGRCLAVAGWRLVATTAALRKIYVDDLVATAARRGQGTGRRTSARARAPRARRRLPGARPRFRRRSRGRAPVL